MPARNAIKDSKGEVGALIFLCAAFFTFFVAQITQTAAPILSRSLPVEVDDAYGYILKAEELRSACFFQNCRALNDLREQFLTATDDATLAYSRAREYHRVFVVYHPLHSIGMVALNAAGFSYEAAYNLLAIAGKVLLCFGLAYWLRIVFGMRTTAITLLLISPVVFLGQGIQTMVPSNMALGLAFFGWGFAFKPKPGTWKLLIPILLSMLLLHQVGRLYAIIALTIYGLKAEKPFSKDTKMVILVGLFVTALFFLLPVFFSRPEFSFDPAAFYPGEWSYVSEVVNSISTSLDSVQTWLSAFGYTLLGVTLVGLGFLALTERQRPNWLIMFGTLLALLTFSFFYVTPWFGALVFERAWISMAILMLGLIGQLILTTVEQLSNFGRDWIETRGKKSKAKIQPLSQKITAAIVFLFISLGLYTYFPFYSRHFFLTLNNQINHQNFALVKAQPESILANRSRTEESTFLYMDEIALYYYLTNGGLDYGAIYYPAIHGSPEESHWLADPAIDYLVGSNPIYRLSHDPEMGIVLDGFSELTISSNSEFLFDSLEVYIAGVNTLNELQMAWKNGEQSLLTFMEIPAGTTGWLHISPAEFKATRVTIKLSRENSIRIEGIRLYEGASTNWPWDPGVRLELVSPHGETITVEVSENWLANQLPLNLEVINDEGFTVLAQVGD